MDKFSILKKYFGHNSFRILQEDAVDAILNSQDLLMVLPTGGGKSLCYQLPTLLIDGVTVVISPLLALMHDQVLALNSSGISAEMLSSIQSFEEIKEIENRVFKGEIKLLYISPERLLNSYFLELLSKLKINFFVIDEAHCVSQWGHEFRQDYRKLGILKQYFPTTTIAAFTATATKQVEQDIIKTLKLQNPKLLRGSLFRKNLTINAKHRIKDGKEQLLEFVNLHKNQSGIVYTLSRKSTQTITNFLQSKDIKALAYHAGLSAKERNNTYKKFLNDEIDVVVATIAFGMGIDKSNIRYVVHLSLPKTIENYYQEIGRAGRDGLESETLLLFNAQDIINQKHFIEKLEEKAYKLNALSKLESMARYANSEICRHKLLANYFQESIDVCLNRCDNCLSEEIGKIDITKASQMLLSAIWRTNQNFGLHYIIDILRGSKEKRILQNGHNNLSVYGIGKEYLKAQWLSIADRLLELNAIEIGEYKVYKITPNGISILKGKESVNIKEERLIIKHKKVKKFVSNEQDFNSITFEKLRELRKEVAKRENIPPYIVFNDKTLKDMSVKLPKNRDEMLNIHGIGEIKYKKYGKEFLEVINELG